MANKSLLSTKDYGSIEGKEPFATYIKSILAKVYVKFLSPYTQEKEDTILEGNPKSKNNESCIIDVWSMAEDRFFHRENQKHFDKGILLPYTRKEIVLTEEDLVNSLSDEALKTLLAKGTPFFTLQNKVNKMTSVAPISRLIEFAKEMEKSEKILTFLQGKLSELQMQEFPQLEN
jgi:hypothetical protein